MSDKGIPKNINEDEINKTAKQIFKHEACIVYLLLCKNGNIYTGITKSLHQRISQHRRGIGAKYTKIHGVDRLLGFMKFGSRSDASHVERFIKKMKHDQKIHLAAEWGTDLVL